MKTNQTRARRSTAALTVLGSALALFACGGGGGGGDFAAQVDQACITTSKAYAAVNQSPDGLQSDQQQAIAATQQFLAADQTEVSDLKAIEPPSDLQPAFDKFVSLNQQFADTRQQLLTDFQANDTAAATADTEKLNSLRSDAKAAAESLGLEACAGKLPADQVTELTSTIQTNETSTDPSKCTEYLTTNGSKTRYPLGCEHLTQSPSNAASSVDVSNVTGTDGVSANAEVTFHGGSLDGQTLTYELVLVDGKWMVNYSSAPKAVCAGIC